ncbi:peptidoglycan-binding domain-containing protein [Microbacterium sp. RURRCA19A]|uniref:peptidoglycan-binding domain-containing protein n=1 Tax=Microbacterium sp. RURRCA19A TaxID=1907391 RepID=UPI00158E505D|nr:peptidoglycan-binding domain-containing protein [Microbacterium sp. RURRCA19A]
MLALVLVMGVVAVWCVAAAFTSPQQIEAASTPPDRRPVTAEIGRGSLQDTRNVSGSVRYAEETKAVVSPIRDADRSVVTSVSASDGTQVTSGALVLSVNDCPVFFLDSPFPMYRDMGPEDMGSDVKALQENLVAVGLLGEADGVFGAQTQLAVQKLFERANAVVPQRSIAQTPEEKLNGVDNLSSSASTSATFQTGRATSLETFFPMSSAITAASNRVVVRSVPEVGTIIDGTSSVSFASSNVVVEAPLFSDVSPALVDGATVEVTSADGEKFSGVARVRYPGVSDDPHAAESVGGSQSAATSASQDSPVIVVVADGEHTLDDTRVGQAAVIRLVVQTLASDALLVPRVAVAEGESGLGTVLLQVEDGSFEVTRVRILAALGGQVAIESLDREVAVGDKVGIE